MMGQMGAMNMQMVARSWLVYELTDQYVMLGLVMLANAVPMLFLSLFGGVMADRIQKKTVLVYGQSAFALVSLATAVAIVMGVISLERQTGVAFLMAAQPAGRRKLKSTTIWPAPTRGWIFLTRGLSIPW